MATSPPILPSPIIPNVFSNSSFPTKISLSHFPLLIKLFAATIFLEVAIISPIAISQAETVLLSGVFATITPCAVASGIFMLSVPFPARPTIFRFLALSSNSLSTFMTLLTIRASYS